MNQILPLFDQYIRKFDRLQLPQPLHPHWIKNQIKNTGPRILLETCTRQNPNHKKKQQI